MHAHTNIHAEIVRGAEIGRDRQRERETEREGERERDDKERAREREREGRARERERASSLSVCMFICLPNLRRFDARTYTASISTFFLCLCILQIQSDTQVPSSPAKVSSGMMSS